MSARDTSLDTLLDLDGQTMFVGETYWVNSPSKQSRPRRNGRTDCAIH